MSIYQHFREEEKVFIDQVLEWQSSVEKMYAPKLTAFLDPREQQILLTVIGHNEDCLVFLNGGYDGAERQRALLYPSYFEPSMEEMDIDLLEISFNNKFHNLTHRQVLGTIMSLGLGREKFGDVLIGPDRAQLMVSSDISDYCIANISKMGNAGVKFSKKNLLDVMEKEDDWLDGATTASSLRVDAVLSAFTNLSRAKVQELIIAGRLKVNHQVVEKNDFECGAGDLLSVRGLGRFAVKEITGKTKKDKWRISYGKQKK
ncbi:MAG: RNA-binding protein [Bacillus sp. (in: firmicutes)]